MSATTADTEETVELPPLVGEPTVDLDTSHRPMSEPFECGECDGAYVMYDGDKVCMGCGLMSGSADREYQSEWESWREYRRENYSGFIGEDRARMVGGFLQPWFTDDGELAI